MHALHGRYKIIIFNFATALSSLQHYCIPRAAAWVWCRVAAPPRVCGMSGALCVACRSAVLTNPCGGVCFYLGTSCCLCGHTPADRSRAKRAVRLHLFMAAGVATTNDRETMLDAFNTVISAPGSESDACDCTGRNGGSFSSTDCDEEDFLAWLAESRVRGEAWVRTVRYLHGQRRSYPVAAELLVHCTASFLRSGVVIAEPGGSELVLTCSRGPREALGRKRLVVRDARRLAGFLAALPLRDPEVLREVLDAVAAAEGFGYAEWVDGAPPALACHTGGAWVRSVTARLQRYALVRDLAGMSAATNQVAAARTIQRAARTRATGAARARCFWRAPEMLDAQACAQAAFVEQRLLRVRGGGRPLGLRAQGRPSPVSGQAESAVRSGAQPMASSERGWARSTWRLRPRDAEPMTVDAWRIFDGGGARGTAQWDGDEPDWLRRAGDDVWSPEEACERAMQPTRTHVRRQLLASLEAAASCDAASVIEAAASTVQSRRMRPSGRLLRKQRSTAARCIQRAWRRRAAAAAASAEWRRGALTRLVGRLAVAEGAPASGCEPKGAKDSSRGSLITTLYNGEQDVVTGTATLARELRMLEGCVAAAEGAAAFERRRYEARERLLRREAEERKGREAAKTDLMRSAEARAKAATTRAEAAEAALPDATKLEAEVEALVVERAAAEARATAAERELTASRATVEALRAQLAVAEAAACEQLIEAAAQLKMEATGRADADARAAAAERELAAALCPEPAIPSAPVPIARRSGGRQQRMARLQRQNTARDALGGFSPRSPTAEGPGGHWTAVAEAQRELARRFGCDPLEAARRAEQNLAAVRRVWVTQPPKAS